MTIVYIPVEIHDSEAAGFSAGFKDLRDRLHGFRGISQVGFLKILPEGCEPRDYYVKPVGNPAYDPTGADRNGVIAEDPTGSKPRTHEHTWVQWRNGDGTYTTSYHPVSEIERRTN